MALLSKGEKKRHSIDTNILADSIKRPGESEKKKMSKFISSHRPAIDHLPAIVVQAKRWYIEYYVWNPTSDKLDRKQNRLEKLLKRYRTRQEKKRAAQLICDNINSKLKQGWNPNLEGSTPMAYTPIPKALDQFLEKHCYQKRTDTINGYKAIINVFKKWLQSKGSYDDFIISFGSIDAINYIDHVYIERQNKLRTRKNHLDFFTTVFNWFVKHGYTQNNPFKSVDRLWSKKELKFRKPIEKDIRLSILNYFEEKKPGYVFVVNYLFQCMIRRTEMCKLKLGTVDLEKQTIYIDKTIAKNGYSRYATIPDGLALMMKKLGLNKMPKDHYLISDLDFYPGAAPCNPRKISSAWSMMRESLDIPKENQFYSLRNTGVIEYLNQGLKPKAMVDLADWQSYDMIRVYDKHINDKAIPDVKRIGKNFG